MLSIALTKGEVLEGCDIVTGPTRHSRVAVATSVFTRGQELVAEEVRSRSMPRVHDDARHPAIGALP